MKKGFQITIITVLSSLVIGGMVFSEIYSINNQYKYIWSICTPEEQGMNSTTLTEMANYIESSAGINVGSLLIIRHNCLVYEYYANNSQYGIDTIHHTFSVTKSFVSAMIGIAVDMGYLSVDDYVLDYFPNCTIENLDSNATCSRRGILIQ